MSLAENNFPRDLAILRKREKQNIQTKNYRGILPLEAQATKQ